MKKVHFCIFALFLFGALGGYCQLPNYDKERACKFIFNRLVKNSNWELLSDNRDYSYFLSKKDFKENHKLIVIPVYDMLMNTDSSYKLIPNYSFFSSFVFKGSSYLGICNGFDYKTKEGKRHKSFAVGYDNLKLYQQTKQTDEIFYDNGGKVYRILRDGELLYWDYNNEVFVLDRKLKLQLKLLND